MTSLPPIDTPDQRRALRISNRRVLTAAGAIFAAFPGWYATWRAANVGRPPWAHPATFAAERRRVWVYGETLEVLASKAAELDRAAAEEAAREDAFWSITPAR